MRILATHEDARPEERHDVIAQPADEGVMQSLRGRRAAISLGNFGICHEGFDERFQVGILETGHKAGESLPEFANVFGGFREVIREIDFRVVKLAEFVDRDLKPVLVLVQQTFDLEKVVLVESIDRILDVVPHLGFNLTGAIAQSER